MAERQKHGFDYQNKIILKEKLIGDYHYSDKWDAFDPKYNLPCSIKCIGIENSIELGDFKRQQNIDYDFILYVGFWQKTKTNIIEEYGT